MALLLDHTGRLARALGLDRCQVGTGGFRGRARAASSAPSRGLGLNAEPTDGHLRCGKPKYDLSDARLLCLRRLRLFGSTLCHAPRIYAATRGSQERGWPSGYFRGALHPPNTAVGSTWPRSSFPQCRGSASTSESLTLPTSAPRSKVGRAHALPAMSAGALLRLARDARIKLRRLSPSIP